MDPSEQNELGVVDPTDDVSAAWIFAGLLAVGAFLLWIELRATTFHLIRPAPSKSKLEIMAISNALDDYAVNHGGRYPDRLSVLLEEGPESTLGKRPGGLPLDEWGRPYLYRAPVESRDPCVYTLGRDGLPGGSDEDADLSNLMLLGYADSGL